MGWGQFLAHSCSLGKRGDTGWGGKFTTIVRLILAAFSYHHQDPARNLSSAAGLHIPLPCQDILQVPVTCLRVLLPWDFLLIPAILACCFQESCWGTGISCPGVCGAKPLLHPCPSGPSRHCRVLLELPHIAPCSPRGITAPAPPTGSHQRPCWLHPELHQRGKCCSPKAGTGFLLCDWCCCRGWCSVCLVIHTGKELLLLFP